MAEPLSDRARDVLHAIIREYISTGDPVGSQQLATGPPVEMYSRMIACRTSRARSESG